jgi:Predicted Co/Zn/Cd cation transporters
MCIRLRLRRRRLRFLLPGVLLVAVLAASGCGSADRDAGDPADYYGNDGYMGVSNTNPNLPLTGSAWSYRRDNAFAAELLRGLDGIRHVRITRTGGSNMRVHLDLDKSLSREEAERIAARAEALLKENFPRYKVTVSAGLE